MADTPSKPVDTFTHVSPDVAQKFPTGANPGETRAQQRERRAKEAKR